MRLKDLWALLKDSWNAWSTDKAPRLGAALAPPHSRHRRPGLLQRPSLLLPSWSLSSPSRLSSLDKRQCRGRSWLKSEVWWARKVPALSRQ